MFQSTKDHHHHQGNKYQIILQTNFSAALFIFMQYYMILVSLAMILCGLKHVRNTQCYKYQRKIIVHIVD